MVDLLNVAPCGIFSFNDEGVIVQANNTICALVKRNKEHLIYQKVNTIFTIPTLIFYQTHFYPLLKMQHFVDEIFITLKTIDDQEIPVLLSARRVEDEHNIENVCTCLPIHNRKNYEDEIIAAKNLAQKALEENSDLIQAKASLQRQIELLDEKMFQLQQRNEELQELNMSISHDLQEPIRKLYLFSDQLLHNKSKLPLEQTLQKIGIQSLRLKNLLLSLQDLISLDNNSVKYEQVDLNEIVVAAKQRLLEKYIDLEFDIQVIDLPIIQADRSQFIILFYELLSNSVKFRSADRPLKITIQSTALNYNQFRTLQDRYQYSDHYKIVYSDNGQGFDEKYKEHIFGLFRKLSVNAGGLGKGLALVKKIVANHKGTITAYGQEEQGCCFTIYLPANL